ncbi:MAG: hypothetical protein WD646_02300 [Actinomycetota bacterium]
MKPIRWLVMTALALAGLMTAMSGTASAQDPAVLLSDLQIMVENAPGAGDELAAGLQEAIDTLASTQSAEETAAAIGDALVAAGSALVAGTQQFGALGLGLTLMNLGFQSAISPVVVDIIDEQNPQAVLDPAHLEAILANLPTILEEIQNGAGTGCGAPDGLVHLLEGNVIEPPLGIGEAFWSCAVVNALLAGFNATTGTPLEGTFQFLGISSIVIGAAIEPNVTELEGQLAPVFDALAPVTDQIIAVLEGV